jgi:predicted DNA-binding transcriptional regulator YafY
MHSPITRLLTVLELLQSYKQMSGTELARRLEVDARTVRRYIVALQDMGIPVEAERGPYGAYQLERGFKLPPLMFTDSEAIALTLGLIAIREFHFPVDVAAVEGALAKTERVMPEKPLQQVRALQEAITFRVTRPPNQLSNDFVALLSTAVQQSRRVHLTYRAWSSDDSERDFDPYGIVFNDGYWFTVGYCHLRHDLRTFRLDRIVALEAGEDSFDRPEPFDALAHVLSSLKTWPGTEQVEVLLKTSLEHARESVPPEMGTFEMCAEGVIFRRAAYQLEWTAYALLQLDFPVVVLQPAELRKILRRIASKAEQIVADSEEIQQKGDDDPQSPSP